MACDATMQLIAAEREQLAREAEQAKRTCLAKPKKIPLAICLIAMATSAGRALRSASNEAPSDRSAVSAPLGRCGIGAPAKFSAPAHDPPETRKREPKPLVEGYNAAH